MNYLKEKKTNIFYNFFSRNKSLSIPQISKENDVIYILGKKFEKGENTNKEIELYVKNIPWFSYRKNFDPIIDKNSLTILNSDNGWGCMIRVGQTMLFLVLKKYFKNTKSDFSILREYFKEKKNSKNQKKTSNPKKPEEELKTENNFDLFSIQNFVITAQNLYNKKPGNWFRSTTFLLSLETILKKNFQNLKIVNFVENIIIGKKLINSIYNKKIDTSKFKNFKDLSNYIITNKWDNQLILSISTMLGLKNIEKKYKLFMDRFLETNSNMGVLGGYRSSAYFIIGKGSKNNYYYLDPHYVKECLDFGVLREKIVLRDFLDKYVFEIEYEKLNKSVSFVFYFRGREDFKGFVESLEVLKKSFGDEFFFSMMVEDFEEDFDFNEITSF